VEEETTAVVVVVVVVVVEKMLPSTSAARYLAPLLGTPPRPEMRYYTHTHRDAV
jgi:hypothetical protein